MNTEGRNVGGMERTREEDGGKMDQAGVQIRTKFNELNV